MATDLKSCPHPPCRGVPFVVNQGPDCYWVQCGRCQARGPKAQTRSWAERKWNRRASDGK